MSDQITYSTMYVELGCLLDVRIGTLMTFSGDLVEKALLNGYHSRQRDVFEGVDELEYNTRYNSADKRALKGSMVTPVATMMRDFTFKTRQNVHNSPFHYKPKIVVNTHPYQFTDEEAQILLGVVRHITTDAADVELITKPHSEVTPKYLADHISVAVMYRYDLWLETHAASGVLERSTCPNVTLIGPRIYFKDPGAVVEKDPFEDMEKAAAPFVGLVLMPIDVFSLVFKPEASVAEDSGAVSTEESAG